MSTQLVKPPEATFTAADYPWQSVAGIVEGGERNLIFGTANSHADRRDAILIAATLLALVLAGPAAYFVQVHLLDDGSAAIRDEQRASDAKLLRDALERYRTANGKFPSPYGDNSILDLKVALVNGGFLKSIPTDPSWNGTAKEYRYVSSDGVKYGILFNIEKAQGDILAGGSCLMGVGTQGTGWWGEPPRCPF